MKNKTDYTYKYENNVEPGTAKLVVTGKGNFTGTTTRKFTIEKLAQPATLKKTSTEVTYEKIGKTEKLSFADKKESPTITYTTSNAKVATVKSGVITFKGGGTATIKAKLAATKHYKAKTLSFSVKVLKEQTIKSMIKTGAKIGYTTKPISLGAEITTGNGTLFFKSSDESILKVDSAGNLSFADTSKLGDVTITLTASKTSTFAKGTKALKLTTVKGKPQLSGQTTQSHMKTEAPFALGIAASEPVELEYRCDKDGYISISKDGIVTINAANITEDVIVNIIVQSRETGVYEASDPMTVNLEIKRIDLNDPSIYMKQDYGSSNCTFYAFAHMMRRRIILDGRNDWEAITRDAVEDPNSALAQAAWIQGQGLRGSISYTLAEGYILEGVCVDISSMGKDTLIQLLAEHPEGIECYDEVIPHAVLVTGYDAGTDTFYCVDSDPGHPEGIITLAGSLLGDRHGNNQDAVLAGIGKYWYLK